MGLSLRRITTCSLTLLAGGAGAQPIPQDTELRFEVRHFNLSDNLGWADSLSAGPGDRIEVRAVVSYTGTATVYGLGQIIFQPLIANWYEGDMVIGTPDTPMNRGIGPLGSNSSTPPGYVPDVPGTYGRIVPWAGANTTTSNYYRGHIHINPDGTGSTYLRIARNDVTNWIGVGPSSGSGAANNTSGGGGVIVAQGTIGVGRPTQFPPQNNDLTDISVFKFSFLVGASTEARDLLIYPAMFFPQGPIPDPPQQQGDVRWYSQPNQTVPGLYRSSFIGIDAVVHVVPTPSTVVLTPVASLLLRRRRTNGGAA
ncbi:hypothetical protein PHYC_03191 [Phycisphaerales bacterium]|nr:hypothetical protein PHYC_03191 [Phycisphaerales bacterium]